MLLEIPPPVEYKIYLKDGRTLINYFVTDSSARRWAYMSHLSDQILRVTRDHTVVVFSRDDSSDNSAI
jgi:hypothetical protein